MAGGGAILLLLLGAFAALAHAAAHVHPESSGLGALHRYEVVMPRLWSPATGHLHPAALAAKSAASYPRTLRLDLDVFGRTVVLDLERSDGLLPDSFVSVVVGQDGLFRRDESPVAPCHYRGSVRGEPGSSVALSTCHGIEGSVTDATEGLWVIEPAAHHQRYAAGPLADGAADHVVVYREADMRVRPVLGCSHGGDDGAWGAESAPVGATALRLARERDPLPHRTAAEELKAPASAVAPAAGPDAGRHVEAQACADVSAFAGFTPAAGCACRSSWSYGTTSICSASCANPDSDPNGPWCYTAATCAGKSWSYCTRAAVTTPCTTQRAEYAGTVPPAGCACRSDWTYKGVRVCNGQCENPLNEDTRPWCYTNATCAGQNWAYCARPASTAPACTAIRTEFATMVPNTAGCACRGNWTYAGKTFCGGKCENPDSDPNGAWCYTTNAAGGTCSKSWSYCANPAAPPPANTTVAPPPPSSDSGTGSDGGVGAPPTGVTDTGSNRNVELLLVNDFANFQLRGSSTVTARDYAIGVGNMVREIYRRANLNIVVNINAVVTFAAAEPTAVRPAAGETIEQALDKFTNWHMSLNGYRRDDLTTCTAGSAGCLDMRHDNAQLLTGIDRSGSTTGLAWMGTICSGAYSAGVDETVASSTFVAYTVAHELGHNMGARHDSDSNTCNAANFVMAAVGSTSMPNTTTWSTCSVSYFTSRLQTLEASGASNCLVNQPTAFASAPVCGNGIREGTEACDLGSRNGGTSPCTTGCQLASGAQCGSGVCCDTATGRFRTSATQCRARASSCDVAEFCTGASAECPRDASVVDGTACAESGPGSRCFKGACKGLDAQCKAAFAGYTGNWVAGGRNGKPGSCVIENDGCGRLMCTNTEWTDYCFTYACSTGFTCTYNGQSFTGTRDFCSCLPSQNTNVPPVLVEDGTPCGAASLNRICVNRTCVPRAGSPRLVGCTRAGTCSGRGTCAEGLEGDSVCLCDAGYTGDSCQTRVLCNMDCAAMNREGCRSTTSCGGCLAGFASSAEQFGPSSRCDLPKITPALSRSSSLSTAGTNVGMALDGNPATIWQARFEPSPGGGLKDPASDPGLPVLVAEFAEELALTRYDMTSAASNPAMDPASWTVEGSSDNSRWVEVDTRTGVSFGGRLTRLTFLVRAPSPFKFYRVIVTDVFDSANQGTTTINSTIDTTDANNTEVVTEEAYVPRVQLAELTMFGEEGADAPSGGDSSSSSAGVPVGAVVGGVLAALIVVGALAGLLAYRSKYGKGAGNYSVRVAKAERSKSHNYGAELPMVEPAGPGRQSDVILTLAGSAALATSSQSRVLGDRGPLPPGWEEFTDDSCAPYYSNGERTTWERPTA